MRGIEVVYILTQLQQYGGGLILDLSEQNWYFLIHALWFQL